VSRRRDGAPARGEAGDARPPVKPANRFVRLTAPAAGSGPGEGEPRREPRVEKAASMPAEPTEPVPPPSPTPIASAPEGAADAPPAAAVTPSPPRPPRKSSPPPASVAPAEATEHPSACPLYHCWLAQPPHRRRRACRPVCRHDRQCRREFLRERPGEDGWRRAAAVALRRRAVDRQG